MDQDTVVNEQIDSGAKLITALATTGFQVRAAFWAKPTEEDKWFLYLASPWWDEKGPQAAYRHVFELLRTLPEVWIDPFEIRLLGSNDSLTATAVAATAPRPATGPFAAQPKKPYPGMTRYGGSSFGGMSVDGVKIYPPSQHATVA